MTHMKVILKRVLSFFFYDFQMNTINKSLLFFKKIVEYGKMNLSLIKSQLMVKKKILTSQVILF